MTVKLTCSVCRTSKTVEDRPVEGKPLADWWRSVGERCARCRATADRDRAIEAVGDAASPAWKDRAWEALCAYLVSHREFFVDDFWEESGLDEPAEARALGPLILRAARENLIVRTGRSRPSVRSHMSDKPIWRSCVHAGLPYMTEHRAVERILAAFPGSEVVAP